MTHPQFITVETPDGPLLVKGRAAWALIKLMGRGQRGVTPLDEPMGPRWAAYVYKLKKMGLDIETLTETHGGAYPGHHARYVLHTPCRVVDKVGA